MEIIRGRWTASILAFMVIWSRPGGAEQAVADQTPASDQVAALTQRLEQLTDRNHTLEQALAQTQTRLENQRQATVTLQAQVEERARQNQALSQQLAESQAQMEALRQQLQAQLAEHARQNQALNQQLTQSRDQIERLRRQLAEREKALKETQETLETTRSQLTALQGAHQTLEGRLAETRGQLTEARDQAARLTQALETARAELAQTRDKLQAAHEKLAATEQDLAGCRSELAQCGDDLARVQKLEAQMSARLTAAEIELMSMAQAMRDDDGDGVPNARDRCPATPAGFTTDARGCLLLELPGLRFSPGSARLGWKARAQLEDLAARLRGLPVHLEVQGHTDNVGKPELNQALSQRRAEAVARYLIRRGVAPDALLARGYGDSQPVADNATPEGRAQNRRVVLIEIPR